MAESLAGVSVAVIGGDKRQLLVIDELLRLGATVKVVGYPQEMLPGGLVSVTLKEALENADAAILPMPGTDNEGNVRGAMYAKENLRLTPQLLRVLPSNAPVLTGVAQEYLKTWAYRLSLRLVEIADDDEIAILNSIPTAEGAVEIAMKETEITIHGSNAMVIGLGRVGLTLARLLKAMGANTFVAARRKSHLARGYEMGLNTVDIKEIKSLLGQMDLIFNTVPAVVLGVEELKVVSKSAVIIDLASAPGGVDFSQAEKLGVKTVWALSLPGKVAPKTAGEMLARTIPRIILDNLP
ncbi:MAG: dipicolinate synthase subunit DpsA [Thermoanaerobacteraceae bacterium]|nr:dipicolinate synthase subunit DpsA [Thermoanaerobacteraceae bacterium]